MFIEIPDLDKHAQQTWVNNKQ